VIVPVLRRSLCRVGRVGQFLDVVYEARERPLAVHFRAAAQREAIESLVGAQIPKHRFHRGEPLPVRLASRRRIDARLHARGVRVPVDVDASAKERDVAGQRGVRRAQALRAQRTQTAVALRAAKVRADVVFRFPIAVAAIQRLTGGTDTRARLRVDTCNRSR